ncbi:hypothetical protein C8F01DRAFT_550293 [Mycena amicta]|nr:hypothetical protein C8F01DRAFT_550293 [Mycena amicta]
MFSLFRLHLRGSFDLLLCFWTRTRFRCSLFVVGVLLIRLLLLLIRTLWTLIYFSLFILFVGPFAFFFFAVLCFGLGVGPVRFRFHFLFVVGLFSVVYFALHSDSMDSLYTFALRIIRRGSF